MVTTKTYTFSNVVANHTISAEFSNMVDVLIKMAASSPSNCKIMYAVTDTSTTPSTGWTTINTPTVQGTTIQVEAGKFVHVRAIDIATGYEFVKWHITDVDGEYEADSTTNPSNYQAVSGDLEFELTIATTTYIITATAGTGGTITPNGSVTVAHGGNQTFTITATGNYRISRILVDGSPISLE